LPEYGASAADADALSCALRLGSPRIGTGMEMTMGADEGATWRIDDLAARAGELGHSSEQRNPASGRSTEGKLRSMRHV
jgi:hypothetical protein